MLSDWVNGEFAGNTEQGTQKHLKRGREVSIGLDWNKTHKSLKNQIEWRSSMGIKTDKTQEYCDHGQPNIICSYNLNCLTLFQFTENP